MSGERETRRGLGLAASIDVEVVRSAAAAARTAGYYSFWLNNPGGAHALESLGSVARTVGAIQLGVGVIPLSNHQPDEIVREVSGNELPLDRLYLGIGSGGGSGGVDRVAEGVRAIRSRLDCRIVVAALGPRMCRLAGEEADGVLLNWLTPQYAERTIQWVREGSERAGRSVPRLMTYVRVALGDAARTQLEREAARYEAIPQYAAHFERMGVPAIGTAVMGDTPQDIQESLTAWNGVLDEVVVRAITAHDTAEDVTQLLDAARPG